MRLATRALLPVLCACALALSPAAAETPSRAEVIARAQVWTPTSVAAVDFIAGPQGPGALPPGATLTCGYEQKQLNGNSPKFACLAAPGEEVKVKFGPDNGEVFGEVAATRLLWALGFDADRMYPVRVVCRGCPAEFGPPAAVPGARLVDPASIERHQGYEPPAFAGGWSWGELDLIDERQGGATRAQRDALKLLAVFLQHTDTKPEQQRLVCLDGSPCRRPLMMLNDVGLTFGRATLVNENAISSSNLEAWRSTPIWKGDAGCIGNLPKSLSGTLKDPVIGEEGRHFLSRLLHRLSDRQLHDLFSVARMHDVDAWVAAFKEKIDEIDARRCNDAWSAAAPPTFTVAPVLWLQSHRSDALTRTANLISTFGYTPFYLFLATLLALLVRARAGAALMLLLALSSMSANAAKITVAYPRPDAVDARVLPLSNMSPDVAGERDWTFGGRVPRPPQPPGESADTGGFPSGHVAATVTFFFGPVFLFDWTWGWIGMAVWGAAMAWSRMYLGRHFLGDVLGGFGVAVIVTGIALLGLNLARLSNPARASRVARRLLAAVAGLAVLALWIQIPEPYDAGLLAGFAIAAALIVHFGGGADAAPPLVRAVRILSAAVMFGAAWWVTVTLLIASGAYSSGAGPLLEGLLPAVVLLPGPLFLERLFQARRRPAD